MRTRDGTWRTIATAKAPPGQQRLSPRDIEMRREARVQEKQRRIDAEGAFVRETLERGALRRLEERGES